MQPRSGLSVASAPAITFLLRVYSDHENTVKPNGRDGSCAKAILQWSRHRTFPRLPAFGPLVRIEGIKASEPIMEMQPRYAAPIWGPQKARLALGCHLGAADVTAGLQ